MRLLLSGMFTGGFLLCIGVMAAADTGHVRPRARNAYQQHNLVSDGAIEADHTDPDLVNPWGIAFNPAGDVWVADNGTGVSTLYDGNGVKSSLVVTIPALMAGETSTPNGIVFNATNTPADFNVAEGVKSGPSVFLFSTEDGTIAGWSPAVDLNNAVLAVRPRAGDPSPAVYKGIAIAGNGARYQLYATDFHNAKIDVFGPDFAPVQTPGGFVDPHLPRHFAPFGIQNISGNLYVTYAKQRPPDNEDDLPGAGLGLIDVFDPDGNLIRRFASRGALDAPWGIAEAPDNFGKFSNHLLVGNFGDGRINAFDLKTGEHEGFLETPDHHPLVIDGLWGIAFGNGVSDQPSNTLFFAAGPNDEADGLYGRISAAPSDDDH
jgi:uncharacterized protein (TIGR03118 family)